VKAIFAIAGNTLKEGLRSKLFYILLGIAFMFLLVARGCMSGNAQFNGKSLSPEEVSTFATAVGFHVIIFWGLTLAGLLSMGSLVGDIETGIITVFISKPISRFEYLMGKFIGVFSVVLVNMAILGLGFFFLAYLKSGAWMFSLFIALAIFSLNICLLISFIFFASLFSSRIIAMLMGIIGYVLSLVIDIFVYFDALRENIIGSKTSLIMLNSLYFALPQWGSTQFYAASFIHDFFSQSLSFWPIPHTILYIMLIWLLMILLFRRKEF